jgi:hypothetical protein
MTKGQRFGSGRDGGGTGWSAAGLTEGVKRRTLEKSCDPDMTVCYVARRHDLDPIQLYSWHKLYRQDIA